MGGFYDFGVLKAKGLHKDQAIKYQERSKDKTGEPHVKRGGRESHVHVTKNIHIRFKL